MDFLGNKKKKEKLKRLKEQKEEEETKDLLKDGLRLLKLKQFEAARNEFFNATRIYQNKDDQLCYHLMYNIALSFFYEENYQSAMNFFDKCLGIEINDEEKTNAFLYKGVSMVKKGDMNDKQRKKALELFGKVIEMDNTDVDAWYLKGCMQFELGETKASIESFDRVIELDRDYENIYDINLFYEVKRDKIGKKEEAEQPKEQSEIVVDGPAEVKANVIKTKAGLTVGTEPEQKIADFLSDQGLEFQYRPTVSLADSSSFSTGFYIPKYNVYLEHFGVDETSKVDMDQKINQFEDNKKKFLFTTSNDEAKIETVLKRKLGKFKRKTNGTKSTKSKKKTNSKKLKKKR